MVFCDENISKQLLGRARHLQQVLAELDAKQPMARESYRQRRIEQR